MKKSVVYKKDARIKHRAYGYTIINDSIVFSDQSMTSSVQGDGGIYTSINDYFKWDQALENNKLISSELKEKAYTIQSINPESEWDYGYGWRIKYYGKTKTILPFGTRCMEKWSVWNRYRPLYCCRINLFCFYSPAPVICKIYYRQDQSCYKKNKNCN